ncbi:MAG: hypothetical protein AB7G47_05250 [Mycolicibacterium sp.]|uniref:hypothetical protein n=2 Tax=Mycolicibacterium sp. TaxID=2320850 RepID=UPI003D0E56DB
MKAPMTTLAALLVAGGASLAIAAAPTALAQPNCVETEIGGGFEGGSNTVCESPGDVEIDSRPSVLAPGDMGGMFPWGYGMFIL